MIVGAGQAAAQAVETLRRKGYADALTVIGEEPLLPYQRPPLSKKFLAGAHDAEHLPIRHRAFYDEHAVTLRLGLRATRLDPAARTLALDDGSTLDYDALLLATGSRARRLPLPGAALAGVFTLRTVADVDAIRAAATPGARAVIVGGGYIGLEAAATLRTLGLEVTVLELAGRVMSRVVSEPVSRFFEAEHARHGVRIVLGAGLAGFEGDTHVRAVRCTDGSAHPADLVIVGVGVAPVDDLARAAGLACDDGIVVDEFCRTSDPHIHAAGDCTHHPSLRYGRRLRLESVDHAFEQATSAALNMLGIETVHDRTPWFWSDQYDLKLVIVGLAQGHDRMVLRGDPASRSFSACYLRSGELIAVDTVNAPRDQMAARKLVAARVHPDPERLADITRPLRDCVDSGPRAP
ncbi:MAG: Ferredoxin--NAD(P)(+) reductase fdr [Steroidobacteraceae bacterium]|nr:Ferredoxin--NAD(P)(+) reductase fdr [Steroidobacteraceae bacterium]